MMTDHLMDIASYQRGVDLAKVRAAGFTIANVKTSQGNGYTFADARLYANRARAAGMRVSLFHWLDNSASGRAQADYAWRTAGPIVADVGAVAFQVDNEGAAGHEATWAITRDFVQAMAEHLGHLPYMYTGDWWATSGGRAGWNVASLTPWLMAAPNNGYPGSYPGDDSPQWKAGYWGYPNLSLMQYAVSGISGAGGGNISKTAIRDPNLWAALTGGTTAMARDYGSYGAPKEVGDRPDSVLLADNWGGEVLGHSPFVPTQKSYRTALLDRVDSGMAELRGAAAGEAVRDAAMKSTVDGLVATINAIITGEAGDSTTLDAAPIIAAINAARDATKSQVLDLVHDLEDAHAEIARLTTLMEATMSPAERAAADKPSA